MLEVDCNSDFLFASSPLMNQALLEAWTGKFQIERSQKGHELFQWMTFMEIQ